MTKPSLIRESLFRYINSNIWLQSKSIQDPLIDSPIINSVVYPPNTITEVPSEIINVTTKSSKVYDSPGVNQLICSMILGYRIVWIFSRQAYKTYHQIPVRQIEDLICKCNQFIMISATAIDADISTIEIPNKGSGIVVRPSEDINSDESGSASWAIVAYINYDVEFKSSPDEFLPVDFNKLQPPTWGLIDGQPVVPEQPFNLTGVNIYVNESKLPAVTPGDTDSFRLDEIIEIRE